MNGGLSIGRSVMEKWIVHQGVEKKLKIPAGAME